MGLSYDPAARKWNVVYENENLGRNEVNPNLTVPTATVYYKTQQIGGWGQARRTIVHASIGAPNGFTSGGGSVTVQLDPNTAKDQQSIAQEIASKAGNGITASALISAQQFGDQLGNLINQKNAYTTNEQNKEINQLREKQETENKTKNTAYRSVLTTVNNTKGGDYVQQRALIQNIQGIDTTL
jgi:hypothetical protein